MGSLRCEALSPPYHTCEKPTIWSTKSDPSRLGYAFQLGLSVCDLLTGACRCGPRQLTNASHVKANLVLRDQVGLLCRATPRISRVSEYSSG